MEKIAAISLDLDDTLWDIEPVLTRANQRLDEFLQRRCPRVQPISPDQETWRTHVERVLSSHPHMRHDFTFIRKEVLRQCVGEAQYPLALADEAFDVFFQARNEVVLYEDVLPALTRLVSRYRLISVSNGNADLQAIGLASFFEFSVAARDVGALKPEPQVFHEALRRADLSAHQVIHVGDDPEADIDGARGAGLRAVWLNRRGAVWPERYPSPEMTVASLTEFATRMAV